MRPARLIIVTFVTAMLQGCTAQPKPRAILNMPSSTLRHGDYRDTPLVFASAHSNNNAVDFPIFVHGDEVTNSLDHEMTIEELRAGLAQQLRESPNTFFDLTMVISDEDPAGINYGFVQTILDEVQRAESEAGPRAKEHLNINVALRHFLSDTGGSSKLRGVDRLSAVSQ